MAFEVTFTLRDAYSRETTRRYHSTRTLLADVVDDADDLLAALEDLSLMSVVRVAIAQVTEYATAPTAGANVDAGGTLHVRLNNNKIAPMRIPAIDPAFVETDGSIDISDQTVTDFTGLFGSGGHWTISEGNTVSAVVSGELDR